MVSRLERTHFAQWWWTVDRPLLVAVKREGSTLTADQPLAFYQDKVAKWWIPDDVVFVKELQLTATGKLQKLSLRQTYGRRFIDAKSPA